MVLKNNKGHTLFLPDEFHEKLVSYRKEPYKYKRTIITTDEFLKEFDSLPDDLKEKAIISLPLIYKSKIPTVYKNVYIWMTYI